MRYYYGFVGRLDIDIARRINICIVAGNNPAVIVGLHLDLGVCMYDALVKGFALAIVERPDDSIVI